MNKPTLACTVVVALCAMILLSCEKFFPVEKALWLHKIVSGYLILLTIYFISQSDILTYFKSRSYSPQKVSDEEENIIYLSQDDEWYEVG